MKISSRTKHIPDPPNEIRVKIDYLNDRGQGIGYGNNHKISVEKTLPEEEVIVEYLPEHPPKDRIRLKKILHQSNLRIEPPCPYFRNCGGCQLQHIPYPEQLKMKRSWIEDGAKSFPVLNRIQVHPVEPMPGEMNYRNKTQMPFQNQSDQVIYGLYRHGTHEIIPIDYCLVESRDANQVLRVVREWANHYQVKAYSEYTHEGILRHVVIRKGQFTHQLMVIIVSLAKSLPFWKPLVDQLKAEISTLKCIILNYNPAKTNIILGKENQLLWGEPYIEEQLGEARFRIYPNTFFQANSVQMKHLIDRMIGLTDFQKHQNVLDLFCGTGTIGLLIAPLVNRVVGLDNNTASILAAQENCENNGSRNAEFSSMEIFSGFTSALPENFSPEIIIIDPPRKGLNSRVIQEICDLKPEKIVYISCYPRSLLENLTDFYRFGYRGEDIFPFDMFPHTSHVESLTILHK